MNRINTGLISDPNIEQGFTGQSLSFVQNAYTDMLLGIAQSVIGESYDSTKAYILKGLDAYGTNQYHPGYVLYAGEIFACGGKLTTTAFSFVPVLNIVVTPDSVADPCPFSDGTPRNVHDNRVISLNDAASGTILLSAAIYVQSTSAWITVGSLLNSWTINNPVRYIKIGNVVHIEGDVTNAGGLTQIVFALPAGYRPSQFVIMPSFAAGSVDSVFSGGIDTSGNVTVQSGAGTNSRRVFYMSFATL